VSVTPDSPTVPAPTQVSVPTLVPPTPTPATPPRLVIPALALDQAIVPLPIVDGQWDLTALDQQIGWLATTGEYPGDDLAMAVIGHVTVGIGKAGPFAALRRLQPNDQVIYRSGGTDYLYAVQSQVKLDAGAVSQLYVPDGQQLMLVTCSDWSFLGGEYVRRLLVTTSLVGTTPTP
jgi:LPXTG-site transpeptidase (sortase) family protein